MRPITSIGRLPVRPTRAMPMNVASTDTTPFSTFATRAPWIPSPARDRICVP